MKITGTCGQYPAIDGVQVSISTDCVVISSARNWSMLEPHDARELAAHLTKAANHVIAVSVKNGTLALAAASKAGT